MGHSVGVVGGDGIGPEVIAEALKVVDAAGVKLDTTSYELGASHYLSTGEVLDDTTLEALRSHDAILLGAIGPPVGSSEVPSGLLERGLLLKLRFALDCYINLRPFSGVPGSLAAGTDFVVVRENTEGPYAGEGGQLRRGTPHEVATQGSVNTYFGVERCVRYAFELAERRAAAPEAGRSEGGPPARAGSVTLVHKTNVLTFAGDLWQRVFAEVGAAHPGIDRYYNHVDAATIYLVTDTGRYDVIVTDNLFGDILTDLAGAVTGGIGLAASGNLNPARTGPSLFEPVHGAAHDIAGTGTANPCAAIRSAAMMLEHLGEADAARLVTDAVLAQQREMAGDEKAWKTASIGDAVARRL
jgi:3-isopropylmalate dehydrogenase